MDAAAAERFTVDVEGFRGPLELLLDLIEQRKLHVNDISLATVADEYIRYVEHRADIPLSETAQFVLVASTLLLIKSRSLLPTLELTHEEEEDIRDLERRLELYAYVRRATKQLRQQWGRQYRFTTAHRHTRAPQFAPGPDVTTENLRARLTELLDALPTFTKAPTARIAREIRLSDVIDQLAQRLERAFRDTFANITSGADRVEQIVSFLALLELVKRGTISAQQQQSFSDIALSHEAIDTPTYASYE